MRSWEVNDDAWEAFQKAEDMCAGIQAAYKAGIRAAGVAPQPEPEYEYGNQAMFNTHTPIMPAPDRDTAMKRAWLQPAFRRVKAGAWEPAPNQKGEQR